MARSNRHVAAGVSAVVDGYANIVALSGGRVDVWVDPEDIQTALDAVRELTGEEIVSVFQPESPHSRRLAIVLE